MRPPRPSHLRLAPATPTPTSYERTDERTNDPTCVNLTPCVTQHAGGIQNGIEMVGEGERYPVVRSGPRGEIPLDVRRGVYRRDAYRCKLCGVTPGERRLDLDHIVPWSAGGADFTGNLRTLCQRCNEERSNFRLHGDSARVLPVTWWCLDCHGPIDPEEPRSWGADHRPDWVRPSPPRFEGNDRMVFAYCAKCDINGYTELTL